MTQEEELRCEMKKVEQRLLFAAAEQRLLRVVGADLSQQQERKAKFLETTVICALAIGFIMGILFTSILLLAS